VFPKQTNKCKHTITLVADIEKVFLMMSVAEEDKVPVDKGSLQDSEII